jgi:2-keto-3-deoxy-L-fuconate dehydrogenase
VQEIISAGGQASAHVSDVTHQQQVANVFSEIFRLWRVHILVNNAGISHVGTVESTTEADFDRVFPVK